MTPPKGSASYKKKDGVLSISRDAQSVSWTPSSAGSTSLAIAVSSITNLQQTPASNPKVMLKIFAQSPAATAPETHVFTFTSANAARAEADSIKDSLSAAIQAAKSGTVTSTASGGSSAAMAIASAVSSTPGSNGHSNDKWYDDARLRSDVELQQSLLKSNPSLMKTFIEAKNTKPDSITNTQFGAQFWATRLHMLRAHAIEKNQARGAYNVLSTIKPKTVDNAIRLSISKEQIQLIFSQHPLVKRVYDENVPKVSEEAFWSRFFQSRLFKKLKGEKIGETDTLDHILDKYLRYEDDASRENHPLAAHIPHIIDVEGNEENHSQRKGNKPDVTMRPSAVDKVPIIRTLNNLSQKIMDHVAPSDIDPSDPVGMDEATFEKLALQDLQGDTKESRIMLNIKDQQRFFSSDKDNQLSTDAALYAKQSPGEVLSELQLDLDPSLMESDSGGGLNLQNVIGVNDDDSDDEDREHQKEPQISSKTSISNATKQVLTAISQRRSQTDNFSAIQTSTSGLTPTLFDRLTLTHATTTEFLHHFWLVFLSGDPDRAGEVAQTVESLNRAMDRIKAVADAAEADREREKERRKKEIVEHYKRTGKKLRPNTEALGGSKVVNEMLSPTVKAVNLAIAEYRKALAAEGIETQA
ncbi:MAG: RNA polymerase II transcription factor B subunit 1 [Trichoglossum hirsutum]|nr:MAG: RNA polymerase II transcription factor B subunit 1 [Trichoglossum hirsutum]